MEYLFNYISFLHKYFNLLVETEEAAELMKQEINTETYQRDRCFRLRKECVKVFDILFQTFNQDLIALANEVTVELFKRDTKGQELLYAQLIDVMNEFANAFNRRCVEHCFSEELIGSKFAKINVEREDGAQEEERINYNFSIAILADDLSDKFNQLRAVIIERFKFLKLNEQPNGLTNSTTTKLTVLLQLYFEKGCKPLKKQQVEKLANDRNIPIRTLVNKWMDLKKNDYNHTENTNNIKTFLSSYEDLMEIFKDNDIPFKDVKNRYDQLKETYPDVTY